MVVLEARLAPAAEYLITAGEDLLSAATQSDSAREQLLRAEAHLSFAKLHMAAAQKFQTPTEEVGAPSDTPVIPARAQLVKALTEARGFEVTASDPQARCQRQWVREALCRTACVSYVALEACEVATQTSWDPQECDAYHDLLDHEERRLHEAFGNIMPEELPGPMVAAAEVWKEDARDNVSMAHTWMVARRDKEEKRLAAPKRPQEPPDGGMPVETARRLWAQRALQQTSYVSHMAQEICDDSTKANWTSWTYHEYRRLLDEEMVTICQIYMEVGLTDLPVREEKEAKEWLTSAHRDAERAQEHIGARIRKLEELKTLLSPGKKGLQQKRARHAAFWETRGASAMSRRRARGAADRARSQANKTLKGTTEFPGGERKKRGGSACQQASDKAEVGLAESDSETDTSDPGGMPQLFRGPRAPGAGLPKTLRMLLRRWAATRGITPRPVVVARSRMKARGPTLLRNLECKVRTGGTSNTSIVSRIAQGAREDGDGEVGSEAAVQGAEESSTTDDDEGSSGFRPALRAWADSGPVE
jgi:hypothetical protein